MLNLQRFGLSMQEVQCNIVVHKRQLKYKIPNTKQFAAVQEYVSIIILLCFFNVTNYIQVRILN